MKSNKGKMYLVKLKKKLIPCVVIKTLGGYSYVQILGNNPEIKKVRKRRIFNYKDNITDEMKKSEEFKLAKKQFNNDYGKELIIEFEEGFNQFKIENVPVNQMKEINMLYFLVTLCKAYSNQPESILSQSYKDDLSLIINDFLTKDFCDDFIKLNKLDVIIETLCSIVERDKENDNTNLEDSLIKMLDKLKNIIEDK